MYIFQSPQPESLSFIIGEWVVTEAGGKTRPLKERGKYGKIRIYHISRISFGLVYPASNFSLFVFISHL